MLLEARNLTKDFGRTRAVHNVSINVATDEVVALIGASGSGKTSLLRLLNRLLEPDQGELLLKGQSSAAISKPEWRRKIGYAVQGGGLFPHMTVRENVGITPKLLGWPERRINDRATELIRLVGLDPAQHLGRYPNQLSGGQRQRVNFARALAAEPDLVLLDEPFSALDAVTKNDLLHDLAALQKSVGFAAVLVTHDLSEALRLASRIAVMEAGQIVQIDTPTKLIAEPATRSIAEMLEAARNHANELGDAFETAGQV